MAYNQCEIIHNSQNKNTTSKTFTSDSGVIQKANGIEKGQPADLSVLFLLGSLYRLDIIITDNPDYQLTEKQKQKGTKVVLFTKNENFNIGHFQLIGNETPSENRGYDCGFECIKNILKEGVLEKSIQEIRNEAASEVKKNSSNFSKIIKSQEFIKKIYKLE